MAKIDYPAIAGRFSDIEIEEMADGPMLKVPRESWRALCAALKEAGCQLSDVTAVDRIETVEIVVHLLLSPSSQMTLKAPLPPDNLEIDSLCPVWLGAEWQEREVYDMFGVAFKDHPDLTRILLVDDFDGHPLRKSFELEEASW